MTMIADCMLSSSGSLVGRDSEQHLDYPCSDCVSAAEDVHESVELLLFLEVSCPLYFQWKVVGLVVVLKAE